MVYPAGRITKVLIIDSNIETLCRVFSLFEGSEFEVAIATTVEGALREARALTPDAIYIDVQLADCNGIELAQRLRMLPALDNTFISLFNESGQLYLYASL